ncbi:MAG: V-type ATPase subunit [candidate division WOR-3 bacterium]
MSLSSDSIARRYPISTFRWSENAAYSFGIGRMKAREPLFFDRSFYKRLLSVPTAQDFLRELSETRYAEFIDRNGLNNPAQIFSRAEEAALQFTLEYVPEEWLRTVLILPVAVLRIKVSLKRQLGADETQITPPELFTRLELPRRLKSWLATHGRTALERAEHNGNPGFVDLYLDQQEIELALDCCQQRDFAWHYYRLAADLLNLKILLRLRLMPEVPETPPSLLVGGGGLALAELTALVGAEDEVWTRRFRGTVFEELVQRGLEVKINRGWFALVEQRARRLLVEFVNRARYVVLGYEPVFRFYRLWENEITNLRLIYGAKVTGLPATVAEELVVYAD